MYQKETPLEEVLGAEMIYYTNHKLMCSVNVDGSAAAVLLQREEGEGAWLMGRAVEGAWSAMTSIPTLTQQRCWNSTPSQRLAAKNATRWRGGRTKVLIWSNCQTARAGRRSFITEPRHVKDGRGGRMIDSGATSLWPLPVQSVGRAAVEGNRRCPPVSPIYTRSDHLRRRGATARSTGPRIGLTTWSGRAAACALHFSKSLKT